MWNVAVIFICIIPVYVAFEYYLTRPSAPSQLFPHYSLTEDLAIVMSRSGSKSPIERQRTGENEFECSTNHIGVCGNNYGTFEAMMYLANDGERYTSVDKILTPTEGLLTDIVTLQKQERHHSIEHDRLEPEVKLALVSFPNDLRTLFKSFCFLQLLNCSQKIADNEAARASVLQLKEYLTSSWPLPVTPGANEPDDGAGTTHEVPRAQGHQHYHGPVGVNDGNNPTRDYLEDQIRKVKHQIAEWTDQHQFKEEWQRFEELFEKMRHHAEQKLLYQHAIMREKNAYNQRWEQAIDQLKSKFPAILASFGLNGGSIEVDRDRGTITLNPGHFADGAGAGEDPDILGQVAFGIARLYIEPVEPSPMAFVVLAPDRRFNDATWANCQRQIGMALRHSGRQGLILDSELTPGDLLDDSVTQRDLRRPAA